MNKGLKVFSLLGLLSMGSVFAWTWNFTNITDKILLIKLELENVSDNFFNVVGPGDTTSFSWGFGGGFRGSSPFKNILIGEYSEKQAANFPGANAATLPRSGNALDKGKITSAIDARGPWFNSLAKMQLNPLTEIRLLPDDAWNKFNNNIKIAAEKLKSGTSNAQEALKAANIDMANERKLSSIIKVQPASAENQSFRGISRDFIITPEGVYAIEKGKIPFGTR